MKIFLNPGHDLKYDSGAVNENHPSYTEAMFASLVGGMVKNYLEKVGYDVAILQSDNLYYDSNYEDRQTPVCVEANNYGADVFVSLHCNACGTHDARGTECLIYRGGTPSEKVADAIQTQIVNSLGTVDRGIKERPDLIVLKHTNMPAVLVEMIFIDNEDDYALMFNKADDFAAAIARGISDYASKI